MGNVFTAGHDMVKGLARWHQPNPSQCLQFSASAAPTQYDGCVTSFDNSGYDYTSHAVGIGLRYKDADWSVAFRLRVQSKSDGVSHWLHAEHAIGPNDGVFSATPAALQCFFQYRSAILMKFSTNRTITAALALLLAFLFLAPSRSAAEVIDRIVATVNGRVLLQSDLDEALCYDALLSNRSLANFTDDDRRAVLDRLIDQELLREQMKSADFRHAY